MNFNDFPPQPSLKLANHSLFFMKKLFQKEMEKKQSKQCVYFYNSSMAMTSPTSSYQQVQQQTNSNAPTTPNGKPKKVNTLNQLNISSKQYPK